MSDTVRGLEKLENAISSLDDRFLLEAMEGDCHKTLKEEDRFKVLEVDCPGTLEGDDSGTLKADCQESLKAGGTGRRRAGHTGVRKIAPQAGSGQKSRRIAGILCAIAAGICLVVGLTFLWQTGAGGSIAVYACESDMQLVENEPVLMSGTIDDNGRMQGHPLQFYILGDGIQSIRFSCKNEWISFTDWTGQRGDYGFSKNFTIPYGEEEEEYGYLVVDWTPQTLIRKLTDYEDIAIADLKAEEREDVIVMEVTYNGGETRTLAIWITLQDSGEFLAVVEDYQITEKDSFIFREDNTPMSSESFLTEDLEEVSSENNAEEGEAFSEDTTQNSTEGSTEDSTEDSMPDSAEDPERIETAGLSDEEQLHVQEAIEDYYATIHRTIVSYVQADADSPFLQEYEGYESDEVVMFEVTVVNSEAKRYITIGSKDGWDTCTVLNEGY